MKEFESFVEKLRALYPEQSRKAGSRPFAQPSVAPAAAAELAREQADEHAHEQDRPTAPLNPASELNEPAGSISLSSAPLRGRGSLAPRESPATISLEPAASQALPTDHESLALEPSSAGLDHCAPTPEVGALVAQAQVLEPEIPELSTDAGPQKLAPASSRSDKERSLAALSIGQLDDAHVSTLELEHSIRMAEAWEARKHGRYLHYCRCWLSAMRLRGAINRIKRFA